MALQKNGREEGAEGGKVEECTEKAKDNDNSVENGEAINNLKIHIESGEVASESVEGVRRLYSEKKYAGAIEVIFPSRLPPKLTEFSGSRAPPAPLQYAPADV